METLDTFMGVFALILIGWALADLFSGKTIILPSIYHPAIEFNRKDDGVVYYLAVTFKILLGMFLAYRVTMGK